MSLVDRVVFVGIDGMGGHYMEQARDRLPSLCPVIASLLDGTCEGFHTVVSTTRARTVFPPISAPAWASALTGMTPDQTGITANAWPEEAERPDPVVRGANGAPRTVFELLRGPHLSVVSWPWLTRLTDGLPEVTTINGEKDDGRVVSAFCETFAAAAPRLSFVHIDVVDITGHAHGWGSDAYLASWGTADAYLATMLAAIRAVPNTAIVLCADHGGSEKMHGDNKESHMRIPLIVAVPAGLAQQVRASPAVATANCGAANIIDIVPTILALLGGEQDPSVRGRSLLA